MIFPLLFFVISELCRNSYLCLGKEIKIVCVQSELTCRHTEKKDVQMQAEHVKKHVSSVLLILSLGMLSR